MPISQFKGGFKVGGLEILVEGEDAAGGKTPAPPLLGGLTPPIPCGGFGDGRSGLVSIGVVWGG
jgi:hypothetical protein